MSIIAIVGDVHIERSQSIGKPGIGNSFNSRILDQIKLLYWVLEKALEENVDTIVFTGDIFHSSRPNYRIVNLFLKYLQECEAYNIDIHIIAGNHDMERTGNIYRSVLDIITSAGLQHVYVYKNINTLQLSDIGITFLPFRDRGFLECKTNNDAIKKLQDILPFELNSIPEEKDKILIGHLAIEGSIYLGDEYDNISNELMLPKKMFHGYDYVWMGHVHKPQVMQKKPYIAHIGSLDISDFGEENQKKHLVIFNTNAKNKFKEIIIPTRKLKHISIEIPIDEENPTEYVKKEIKALSSKNLLQKAIVRIEIKLPDEEMENVDRKVISKQIYDNGAFYICNFSESRSKSIVPISKQEEIEGIFDPKEFVKLFAEKENFKTDKQKEQYIQMAISIIDKYNTKKKGS